jgi:hypothetical protein
MEEIWKKFKEETKGDMERIEDYLKNASVLNPLDKEPNMFQPRPLERIDQEISNQVVLENEKSQTIIAQPVKDCVPEVSLVPEASRKKMYGSLSAAVKEIMEKEHVSRAQAYRKAKKMAAEKSQ